MINLKDVNVVNILFCFTVFIKNTHYENNERYVHNGLNKKSWNW